MAEEHCCCPKPLGHLVERGVAGRPGGRLKSLPTRRAADRDDLNGIETQAATLLGSTGGDRGGSFLQLVIDHDSTGPQ